MSKLSDLIKDARAQHGLSLRDVASMVGVSQTYISMLEHGQEESPTEEVIRGLSEYLMIDADTLFLAANRIPNDVRAAILNRPGFLQQVRQLMVTGCAEIEKDTAASGKSRTKAGQGDQG